MISCTRREHSHYDQRELISRELPSHYPMEPIPKVEAFDYGTLIREFMKDCAPLLRGSRSLKPFVDIVVGCIEQRSSILDDFTAKIGLQIECPILGCSVASQDRTINLSGEIVVIDKVMMLPCCWKFVSERSYHMSPVCPFCRSNEKCVLMLTPRRSLAIGSGIKCMVHVLITSAKVKLEARVGLIEERMAELHATLQEVFMREFVDDLIVMKREL